MFYFSLGIFTSQTVKPQYLFEIRLKFVYFLGTDDVLVSSDSKSIRVFDKSSDLSGDLQVQGPTVFKSYFGRPEATEKEFTKVDLTFISNPF